MKKSKAIETGLIPAQQVIGKDIGKELVAAAQEKNRSAWQDGIVAQVQGLQMQLKKQRDYLENCTENIALLERKLSAIAAGEVTVTPYGDKISFVDAALNKATVHMKECINCGAAAGATSRY